MEPKLKKRLIDLIINEMGLVFESSTRLETVIEDKQRSPKKVLKLLIKHKNELKEANLLPLKMKALRSEIDNLISSLKNEINNFEALPSAFHLFQNSGLFISSIFLYSLLIKQNRQSWLIDLIDNASSEQIKLKQIIDDSLSFTNVTNFDQMSGEKISYYSRCFLPNYNEKKQVGGYLGELRRTLLKGKTIRFKDESSLFYAAEYLRLTDSKILTNVLFRLRYEEVLNFKRPIEIIFTKSNKLVAIDSNRKKITSMNLK